MKKKIPAAAAAVIILSLCACSSRGGSELGGFFSSGPEAAAQSQPPAQSVSAPESKPAPQSEPPAQSSPPVQSSAPISEPVVAADYNVSDYVTVKTFKSGSCSGEYPVLSESRLNAEDAKAANAFFENIKQLMEENVGEYMATDGGADADGNIELSRVQCAVSSGILSVAIQYEYYFGYPVTHNKALCFDLSTGKAIGYDELLKKFGYSESDVEGSIKWYTKKLFDLSAQINMVYDAMIAGTIPASYAADENELRKLYDIVLDMHRSGNCPIDETETVGTPWEKLPLKPYVYCEDGRLYVAAGIASSSIGDVVSAMICVGRDQAEIGGGASANAFNRFDEAWLSPQGAIDKARYFMSSYDDSVSFTVEGLEYIEDDPDDPLSGGCIAYIVSASDSGGKQTARFAASAFDSKFYEISESGELQIIPQGAPPLDWSYGAYAGALGAVVRYPDEYHKWALEPVAEYDLSNGDRFAETVLVCPTAQKAEIKVLKGKMNADMSFTGSPEASFTLEQGQYALIKCSVPEGAPTFALSISDGKSSGTYAVEYNGSGDINLLEYVYSD